MHITLTGTWTIQQSDRQLCRRSGIPNSNRLLGDSLAQIGGCSSVEGGLIHLRSRRLCSLRLARQLNSHSQMPIAEQEKALRAPTVADILASSLLAVLLIPEGE